MLVSFQIELDNKKHADKRHFAVLSVIPPAFFGMHVPPVGFAAALHVLDLLAPGGSSKRQPR